MYSQESISNGVLFAGTRACSFTKKKFHSQCFPVKFVKLLGGYFWFPATLQTYRSVTANCQDFPEVVVHKQLTVFTVKNFKDNQKITKVEDNNL